MRKKYVDEKNPIVDLTVYDEKDYDRKWLAFDTYNMGEESVYLNRKQVRELIKQCEEFLRNTEEEN